MMPGDHQIQSDISIIGAGPAGLLASLWLTKYNTAHILVDSNTFPRQKPCGDVITSNVIRYLNEIDPGIISGMIKKGILMPIKGSTLFTPNNKSFGLLYRGLDGNADIPSCYSMERAAFDNYLMELVRLSPLATVINGYHVNAISRLGDEYQLRAANGQMIRTKLVIGASGSNSTISKILGSLIKEDRHMAVGIRGYFRGIQCEDNIAELILDKSFFPGGIYLVPLPDGLYNVNLVIRKDILLRKKNGLRQYFDQMLEQNILLKDKFINSIQVGEFEGHTLFLGTKKRRLSGQGYMLAGDAGGLINLITGNGIPQAMISGKLAALKALACLDKNDFSAGFMCTYDRDLYKVIKTDLSLGKMINPFLSIKIFQKIAIFFLNILASKKKQDSAMIELFYRKNPVYSIFNPFFYYKLFFKKKASRIPL